MLSARVSKWIKNLVLMFVLGFFFSVIIVLFDEKVNNNECNFFYYIFNTYSGNSVDV